MLQKWLENNNDASWKQIDSVINTLDKITTPAGMYCMYVAHLSMSSMYIDKNVHTSSVCFSILHIICDWICNI